MRVKVKKGSDPLGLATYLLNPDKQKQGDRAEGRSPILAKNMFGRDATQLAEEFRFSHDLNRRVKRTMAHYSISLPPGEQVDDPQKVAIAKDLLKQMGHGDCQYFVVAHHDQAHKRGVQHWHVATSAINLDGQRVDDSYNYIKLKAVERDLEQRYQLQDCSPRPIHQQKNLTSGETKLKDRTGETLPKEKLWKAIDQAITDQPTLPVLLMRLKAQGIEVQFHERIEDEERKLGLSFGIEGSKFQGKRLGKAYSFGGLIEHRGVSYEADRDDELLRQIHHLSADECRSRLEKEQAKQSPQPSLGPERQRRPPQPTIAPELIPNPAPATRAPEAAPAQPKPTTAAPTAPTIDPAQRLVTEAVLKFARQRLKKKQRDALTSSDHRYRIDRHPQSGTITIARQDGTTIAQGTPTTQGWNLAIAQVQPEDEQQFLGYFQHGQQQRLKPQRTPIKPRDRGGIELE
ncbi:relaxase/mobilization nuclease domain-containing protein [Microcoleus sp. FACHB-1515]|uniref:relaxase/mobilization nuclease domain-containing protein n=1 Tax=Cyanophyceae TaxID=3028117 RepID=UPI0016820C12|nr:relaxase/mobilization nuclease domain-containing protein [Microcoleus sp. FACHB-1515]MBD2088302.1 relaxase/mobilization nuclease domain-containing protein [Microcoleus sp. FACHB-1515]